MGPSKPNATEFTVRESQGLPERALFWLEKAMQQGLPLLFLRVNPAWDPLRDSPRFQNLLRRMNFPP